MINKSRPYSVIYGVHAVFELIKQKRRKIFALYIIKTDSDLLNKIKLILPAYPIEIHQVPREVISQKADGSYDHQGIVAYAEYYPFRKKFFDSSKQKFIILLDGVQDVRNVGAIIRSAYCTGVDGVILTRSASASITSATIKAAAGLTERMEIYEAASTSEALVLLRAAGYAIYVTALGENQNMMNINYQMPLCVIIGSEGRGVSKEALKAGIIVTIPQKSLDVSYNASVAAGIILFIISQQIIK